MASEHLPIGDRSRVVFSPRHFADAIEQEKSEVFLLERIEGGTPLPGGCPRDADTRAVYEAWRKSRGI
jgi:hypothetical protein